MKSAAGGVPPAPHPRRTARSHAYEKVRVKPEVFFTSPPSNSVPSVRFSFGVGAGASSTLAPIAVGGHGEIGVQAGVFVNIGPRQNSVSTGIVVSGGATAGALGMVNQTNFLSGPDGRPQSSNMTLNPSIGLAAGASTFFWFGNAGSTAQLSNINMTYNFNIGIPIVGPRAGFGISIGTGPGVWSVSVAPPVFSLAAGGGIDLSMTPSTTIATASSGTFGSVNPSPTQSFGSSGSVFLNPNYQSNTMSINQAGMSNISTANVVSVTVNQQTGQVTVVTNGAPQTDDSGGGDDAAGAIAPPPMFDDSQVLR